MAAMFICCVVAFGQAHYRKDGVAVLNDLKVTPGDTRPGITAKQICDPAFRTGSVRNVTEAEKQQACREYGIDRAHCTGKLYEVDHLASLELAGSNDLKNLWPEPYAGPAGARAKDQVEDGLHRLVCSGKVSLTDAQSCIVEDWYSCGKKHGLLK